MKQKSKNGLNNQRNTNNKLFIIRAVEKSQWKTWLNKEHFSFCKNTQVWEC